MIYSHTSISPKQQQQQLQLSSLHPVGQSAIQNILDMLSASSEKDIRNLKFQKEKEKLKKDLPTSKKEIERLQSFIDTQKSHFGYEGIESIENMISTVVTWKQVDALKHAREEVLQEIKSVKELVDSGQEFCKIHQRKLLFILDYNHCYQSTHSSINQSPPGILSLAIFQTSSDQIVRVR